MSRIIDKTPYRAATDINDTDVTVSDRSGGATLGATFGAIKQWLKTFFDGLYASATALAAHTGNTNNPHAVTKAQVGLASADNTSDANKPVSTAQQAALNAKADLVDNKVPVPQLPLATADTAGIVQIRQYDDAGTGVSPLIISDGVLNLNTILTAPNGGYGGNGGIDLARAKLFGNMDIDSLDWDMRILSSEQNGEVVYWNEGRLTWYGETMVDWFNGRLCDNWEPTVDWHWYQLKMDGDTIVDWMNGRLNGPGGWPLVDWFGRGLSNYDGWTLDWESGRLLIPQSYQVSLDWTSRQLIGYGGLASADWGERHLKNSSGGMAVDWESGDLFGYGGQQVNLSWQNRWLIANGGGVAVDWGAANLFWENQVALDWFNGNLYDYSGNVSANWKEYHLMYEGSKVLHWGNRTLNDGIGSNSVDWGERTLIDTEAYDAVDWDRRRLVSYSAGTVASWFNNFNILQQEMPLDGYMGDIAATSVSGVGVLWFHDGTQWRQVSLQ